MARSRRSDDVDAPAPARSDAYVGLLLISLLAQIAGVVFFYLDYSQYADKKPQLPPAPTQGAPTPTGGAPPAGGAVVPMGGGMAGAPAPMAAGGGMMGGGGMAAGAVK